MKIDRLRVECSVGGKNGISFLLAAIILWLGYGLLFLQPFDIRIKNGVALMLTALLFPLSLVISKVLKADWNQKHNPLSGLGLILNDAQLAYFPIIFWAFLQMPEKMIAMFAIITGGHLFPYGWFYHARGYYVMALIIACSMMLMGWIVSSSQLWMIPMLMSILLFLLVVWLWIDYRRKRTLAKVETDR